MKKYSKLYNSKVFCMMPWVHTHIWPNGNAFPCCMSDSDIEYGNLNDNSFLQLKLYHLKINMMRVLCQM